MRAMILVSASGAQLHPMVLTVGTARLKTGAPSSLLERSNLGALAPELARPGGRHTSGSHLAARVPSNDLREHAEGLEGCGCGYNLLSLPTSDDR
jgi:hypothetical protein